MACSYEEELAKGRKYRKKYPTRIKANAILNRAINSGEIIKPKICSCCFKEKKNIQGHHEDYSKPLKVRWLCGSCHKNLHNELKRADKYWMSNLVKLYKFVVCNKFV